MEKVLNYLIKHNEKISFAESITGGSLASRLISIKNASKVIEESYVFYSNKTKIKRLLVDENIINTFGVVSHEVAYDMAKKLNNLTNAQLCVSTTGYADNEAINHAFIGIYYKNQIKTYKIVFNHEQNRMKNINQCVEEVIMKIEETIHVNS